MEIKNTALFDLWELEKRFVVVLEKKSTENNLRIEICDLRIYKIID